MREKELQVHAQPYLNAYLTVLGTMTPDSYRMEYGNRRYGTGGPEDMNMLISVSVKRYEPSLTSEQIEDFIRNSSAERVAPLVERAKHIASFAVSLVKAQLEEKIGPKVWEPGAKESEPKLVEMLTSMKRREKSARGESLSNYFEFKHIKNLTEKAKWGKPLKEVIKIATAAGTDDYDWLAVVTGIISPQFDGKIDDAQKLTIQEVFAHFTCFGIDEENVDEPQIAA
jgi:hypothetical protein